MLDRSGVAPDMRRSGRCIIVPDELVQTPFDHRQIGRSAFVNRADNPTVVCPHDQFEISLRQSGWRAPSSARARTLRQRKPVTSTGVASTSKAYRLSGATAGISTFIHDRSHEFPFPTVAAAQTSAAETMQLRMVAGLCNNQSRSTPVLTGTQWSSGRCTKR